MAWFGRGAKTPPPPSKVSAPPAGAAKAAEGRALLLIGFNESTQQWEVGSEAIGVLERAKGPLCSVAVCGRARQGKSFLLNQLLSSFTGVAIQKPKGFVVSPTHQSCTRGIWIWSAPIPAKTAAGSPCHVILMDCEGVDAVDQGQKHSAQVFCLAVLLSSVFVYNQLGAIDSVAIERLAMVCELAKRIRAGARGQADFHPSFVWLLRDFQLLLKDGSSNRQLTPLEYLEQTLDFISGSEADVVSKNQMRSTIKTVFPEREAWTLVRPAHEEDKLQRLDALPASELRPEFQAGMDGFLQLLTGKLQPLDVNGTPISGAVYAGLTRRYVEAINAGAVPELVSAWQGVSRAECQRALAAAKQVLDQSFQPDPAMEESALLEAYKRALSAALTAYRDGAMGDATLVNEFEARLRADAEARLEAAKAQLAVVGERLATSLLEEASRELGALMARPGATLDEVEAALRRLLQDYERRVSNGPFKYKKASEFMMNTCIIGIKQHVAGIIAAKAAAQRQVAALEGQLVQARQQAADAAGLQQQLAQAQQSASGAAAEAARLQGEALAHGRALAAEEAKAKEAASSLAAAVARADRLQAEVERLTALESRLAQGQQQLETLQQQLASAATQHQALQQQEAAARQQVARLEAEALAGRQQLSSLQQQVTSLQQAQAQVGALQGALAERDRALASQKEQLDQHLVGGRRVEGERDAERQLANRNLARVTEAEKQLLTERTAHDATREQLRLAQESLRQAQAAAAAAAAAGVTPSSSRQAAGGSGSQQRAAADGGGAVAGRRRRREEEEGDAAGDTPAAARSARRQRVAASGGRGAGADSPVSSPGAIPPEAMAVPVDKAIDPAKMTINDLKAWVTDNNLDDDEFMDLVNGKAKKAAWVAYVQKKLAAAP